jgi:chemotaxis protein methyltransferase CheR
MSFVGLLALLEFIEQSSGIRLDLDKKEFLEIRLAPLMKKLGLSSYHDLCAAARSDLHGRLRQDIVESVTINETSFFRDATPFDVFVEDLLPKILERKRSLRPAVIDVLCAGCSTGQEPWSLAMRVAECGIEKRDVSVRIQAIDINRKMLTIAEEGMYSELEVSRGLSSERLSRFFARNARGWTVGSELRSMVSFSSANLLDPGLRPGLFDIIFCRNVLIYFSEDNQKVIFNNFAHHMPPHGVLMVGSTEIVSSKGLPFTRCGIGNRSWYELNT